MILLTAVLILAGIAACSPEDSVTESTDAQEQNASTGNNAGNRDAAGKANPNTVENMAWTFLTDGIFHNNATIIVGKPAQENPNNGHWMDFKDNGTYEYGIWDKKQYDGKYFYNDKSGIIELSPNGNAAPKSEWQVMHKEDNLILVGTATYGNNATQMRWLRREGYPSR